MPEQIMGWNSSVSTLAGYELDDRSSFTCRGSYFSFRRPIQTDAALYMVEGRGCYLKGKITCA
jgi:hypothetical protein